MNKIYMKKYIIHGIIIYIIIVTILMFVKPSFMYDYDENKFFKFGNTIGKTIFTFPVVSISISVIIGIIILQINK